MESLDAQVLARGGPAGRTLPETASRAGSSVTVTPPFGRDVIRNILPHREPFLLVDRVEELDPGRRIVCVKNLTEQDYYLRRVPGREPTYPITLLAEVMAQSGGILVLLQSGEPGQRIYFASIQRLELQRPLHVGETVTIEAEPIRIRRKFGSLRGIATVEGEPVARGEMRFAMDSSDDTSKVDPSA